tara:strand:- start:4715 stop:6493 length:1779 start_codon:yes stop_codon:yes gene_type:complete
MVKVGLIGYGNWGKILHKKLEGFCDIKFTCRSKDTYLDKLDDVDWVVVSTPNDTHYEIVSNCLKNGKNVFCEKPLTPTYEESETLFEIAESKNLKLYVDDVQNWRKVHWDLMEENLIERKKKDNFNHSYYKTKDLLYRLAYHDIYYLYPHIKNSEIEDVIPIDVDNKLQFKVKFNDISIEFGYDTNYEYERMHHINGVSLMGRRKNDGDPLQDMLKEVLTGGDVDFEYNKEITLFTNGFIDILNKELFKKVAVVGGGIFGCTTAWKLAKEGYDVTLYEKNNDIFTQASNINQYRLHRGYHYPRSKETAIQSQWGETSFLKEYSDAVVNGDVEHYYCIASFGSLVTAEQYKEFLDDMNLHYEEKKVDFIKENVVDLVVQVKEFLFDPNKLKDICWDKLYDNNVDVVTNKEFLNSDDYDYVVNSTYANLNRLLPEDKQKDYQFELCEKPVVQLPEQYKNKSVVIMDGPFMCIDPLGDTGLHVMGNVVHAIHSTNVGKFPQYDEKFDDLLNNGIVKNPSITNIDKFLDTARKFFKDMDEIEHIGSMFTFRTVLPNRDKDDARPTLVEKPTDNIFNLFSGKIGTCVNAAEELLEYI